MANFTKTTEIDISSMHDVMEEETPKKNKWGVIIPIVLSVIIAFGIWIFATEKSTDLHTKTYDVTVQDLAGNELDETIEIEVKGTYSQLADMKSEYIIVKKTATGNYSEPVLAKNALDTLVTVTLTKAD